MSQATNTFVAIENPIFDLTIQDPDRKFLDKYKL